MIPLNDASRRPLHFPLMTLLIIGVNFFVFFLELQGGDRFVNRWALVPARISEGTQTLTFLTSMFMHAGWLHILGNLLFLWVFGPQIEDVMGRFKYLLFYLLGGFAASGAQWFLTPQSTIPNLGASGAIASVMGAFLITYPRDQIRTILFFGWFTRIALVPAILWVGIWFLVQIVAGLTVLENARSQSGGVAYAAHVGGFIFGAVAARIFENPRRIAEQKLRYF